MDLDNKKIIERYSRGQFCVLNPRILYLLDTRPRGGSPASIMGKNRTNSV